jgi:hypothetical protein
MTAHPAQGYRKQKLIPLFIAYPHISVLGTFGAPVDPYRQKAKYKLKKCGSGHLIVKISIAFSAIVIQVTHYIRFVVRSEQAKTIPQL